MARRPARAGTPDTPHTLIDAPAARRLPLSTLLGLGIAVGAGILAGLLWLAQGGGEMASLPSSPEPSNLQAQDAATATPLPPTPSITATATQPPAPPQTTRRAAPQTAPPSLPTATPIPAVLLAHIEGVVGLGGAALWAEDGALLGRLPQGALLTVTARSEDGLWLVVTTEDGTDGWLAAESVIVFDANRLRRVAITLIPVTHTPAVRLPTPTPVGADAAQPSGDGPVARVTLQDSRLNLRAGPGAGYAIVAKAQPDDRYTVLARNAAGDWLQLAVPGVDDGFAWAAAEYLALDGAAGELPTSDAVSNAPAFDAPALPSVPAAPADDAQGQQPARIPPTGLTGTLAVQTEWGGDIYLVDLASGEMRLLTGGFDPAISPDGSQIAFTRIGGEHGLYLINRDGSNERRIFGERELFFSPKWSPDGGHIVFERGDEFIYCRSFGPRCIETENPLPVADPPTERQQALARVDVHGGDYRDIPSLARAHAPDWTTGGIVYHSPAGIQKTADDPDVRSQLVFFNIRKQYELDPDWQPNGDTIVFQRREASHWQLFRVNADGSDLAGMTRPEFTLVDELPSSVSPAWSPDGRHIVFLSNRTEEQDAGPWRIWVMNADGSNQRPLPIDLPITYTYVGEQMLDWGP